MKPSKMHYLIIFFCLGLIFIMMFVAYNFNKRITSLENELLLLKEKGKAIENNPKIDNDKYSKKFLSADDDLKEFQKLIIDYVKKNINKIVSEKPVLGGRWIVTDIIFLSPDIIRVNYEDGHISGGIFLKIESAFDSHIVIKPFW